jgi:glycosyltransferase involved in cell wall biosynthesis
VLAITGDESGCSLWRIWQPFADLTRRGYIADWVHRDDSEKVLGLLARGQYDLIVTPRIVWPSEGVGEQWIGAIHKANIAWCYEVDDDVYSPGIVPRQMALFDSERLKGQRQLDWERRERIRLLELADGVTVTTQRLKTIIQAKVPGSNVKVVPNSIDARWFRETLRGCQRIVPPLSIGWAGGTRADDDLLPLAAAWAEVARRYPLVNFSVQGHIPQVLYDAIPKERRWTLPWLPLAEYPRALLNVDIGCCIVAPSLFNTSKSCIKWYEYTLAGAACVVSDTLYGTEVTHGHDALVAETTADWIEHLSALVESAALRRELNRNARYTVMTQHSLEANWQRWPTAWAELLNAFWAQPRLVLAS